MTSELVLYERRGPAAWLAFNDPDNLNALSPEVIADFGRGLDRAERDREVRAVVLTGTGRAFCAGANLKRITQLLAVGADAVAAEFLHPLKLLLRRLRELPKPVIAAVNGICMAGGMETLLCCDLVIAADDAILGDQHATFGLLPAVGGAQGLIRAVGTMRAREMLFTGGRYSAKELSDWGLVNKVVPRTELDDAAQAMAQHLSERSPAGLARMKQMINDEAEMPWDAATRYELGLVIGHLTGGDVAEGLEAFVTKRKPAFRPLYGPASSGE